MVSMAEVRSTVDQIFPELLPEERLLIYNDLWEVISKGKDLARFTGQISVFKQQARDIAAELPKATSQRKALEKEASKELDKLVASLEKDMLGWRKRFVAEDDSKISVTRFKTEMKKALSNAYIDAYRLGTKASGLVRATDLSAHLGADEKKWLDKVLKQEQQYFTKFLDAIIKGESESKSKNRIHNYAQAVRSVYDSARILQLPQNFLIYWVLESRNPCPDCRLLHKLSPFTVSTLPTTPKAGATRCHSYCYCKLRLVAAKDQAELDRVAKKNKSAEYLLDKLQKNRKKKR